MKYKEFNWSSIHVGELFCEYEKLKQATEQKDSIIEALVKANVELTRAQQLIYETALKESPIQEGVIE